MAKNVRINPKAHEPDYFFPMEAKDPADKEYARLCGLDVGTARLGYRRFEAIFIPCKDKTTDAHGFDVFIDTPSDIQRRRYLDYCKDELAAQDAAKQDGRCNIPDGSGGVKRCPCRIPNPAYTPDGNEPKTIPVRCEGCKFEPYRQAHTFVEISALEGEDENGDTVPYEPAAPEGYFSGDRFLRLRREFLAFVEDRNPKLAPLADALTAGFNKTEAAHLLDDARTTTNYRAEKLKALLTEFLDTMIDF